MKVFIDSDAFLALLNQSDNLHSRAVKLLSKLKNIDDVTYITSWDVIDEVSTKASYRLTKKQAIAFLSYVREVATIIVYPDPSLSKKAQELFTKVTSKKVSMTDCMSMIIVQEMKLDVFFSFDKHFSQQGYTLLEDYMSN
ncbi:MAG: putative ribonuclease VapC [Microgenomates bacterium 39_7]|nr:MAG: putative ribonuclease VapC [Microgenomates bacterium 39_7]